MTHQRFLPLIGGLLFSLLCSSKARSQEKVNLNFGDVFLFELIVTARDNGITEPAYFSVSDTAIYQIFDKINDKQKRFEKVAAKTPLILGVKLDRALTRYFSSAVQSISKDYQTYLIPDSSDAILVAMGINKNNVGDYYYHVVENDSKELVPWGPIPRLEQMYGAKAEYGFLGKYNAPGKRIMIEVVNKKDYSIREGVIFDWRESFKPIVEQVWLSGPGSYFNLIDRKHSRKYVSRFHPKTGLPLDLKFPRDSVFDITLKFKRQETLVHTGYLIKNIDGRIDTTRIGFVDQYGFLPLYSSHFRDPGQYELVVKQQQKVNVWDDSQMIRLPFNVVALSVFSERLVLKRALPYLIGTLFLLIGLFLGYRYYLRQKFEREKQKRALILLKLKSIRSQLNPHFMYNALSSIQNLINKNEVLEANRYLSKFAGLTRKVLETGDEQMTSLQDELKTTEDYLQMELLRYDFHYKFEIAPDLNIANLEVPAMLLQPILENAVKHGVAPLKGEGIIGINCRKEGSDLVLSVHDNGKGFTKEGTEEKGGFGLKLSEERIRLIEQVFKGQPAEMIINSSQDGTLVTIRLCNWI